MLSGAVVTSFCLAQLVTIVYCICLKITTVASVASLKSMSSATHEGYATRLALEFPTLSL